MKSGVSQVNMHGLTRPVGRSVVLLKSKEVARQVANGWQKLLMKQDISITLAVHLCTLINEEQVGMPQTAHSNRNVPSPIARTSNGFSQHNVTFVQVTAVSNAVLETEIFCRRCLKTNNSAIK